VKASSYKSFSSSRYPTNSISDSDTDTLTRESNTDTDLIQEIGGREEERGVQDSFERLSAAAATPAYSTDTSSLNSSTETPNSSPPFGSANLLYPESPKLRLRRVPVPAPAPASSSLYPNQAASPSTSTSTSIESSNHHPFRANSSMSSSATNSRRGYLPIGTNSSNSFNSSLGYSLFAWAARKRVLVVISIVGFIFGSQIFLLGPSLVGEDRLKQWGLEGEFLEVR